MKIIPTIFAHNKKEFDKRFNKLINISKNLQIDFMDGKFVPAKSVQLKDIPNLKKYKNNFEAHLMCFSPEKYILGLKNKGFKKVIFHIEATKNPEKIIQKIKHLKMQPMIAINPETNVKDLPKEVSVLLMGVHPGKEHQSFIQKVYNKIKELRKINKKTFIQVDGGVNEKFAKKLAKLKVNAVNSGSYISNSENPKKVYRKLIQSVLNS
jgi:ribulose-phosphate 3-epimerase